jgi:hypothetical protein
MELTFVILLALLTSTFAFIVMKRFPRSDAPSIREALRAFFEWIGAFTLFLAANVAVGVVVILVIRAFTARFVALYNLGNLLLITLSAVQAFVFRHAFRAS